MWEQKAAAARLRELGRVEVDETALFAMVEQMRQVTDAAAAATRKARRDRARRRRRRPGGPIRYRYRLRPRTPARKPGRSR